MNDDAAVTLAVDVVVLTTATRASGCVPKVLTARRPRPPFQGERALPGALLKAGEDLEEAVQRALRKAMGEHGVRHLEQLATFGDPDRDPRGRVVTVAYLGLLPEPAPTLGEAAWPDADDLPRLAFDHNEIIAVALDRLRGKITYSNVAYGLLPDEFTLSELQAVYESLLGRELDKRNFRKKVLAAEMLREAPGKRRGRHRPAQLYRFTHPDLELLDTVITG
jgi:8-oxo-dGTP diphosphatase